MEKLADALVARAMESGGKDAMHYTQAALNLTYLQLARKTIPPVPGKSDIPSTE